MLKIPDLLLLQCKNLKFLLLMMKNLKIKKQGNEESTQKQTCTTNQQSHRILHQNTIQFPKQKFPIWALICIDKWSELWIV